ncbi:MAG: BatA and WFA domain-containing protein [Gemmatimonadetes bacterium]|nr:BatA and WFA domain-containing protein [Gemmatimonadota bacterium]
MIAFLHPWMLLGLAAASVPILLHLRQHREPPTVPFPAVRYLLDATRQHEKRLRLRHWLLLLLRTLLILALVLAAAGPSAPVRGVAAHPPTALAVVYDNSLSSGVVAGGTPRLEALKRAARDILARATPSDALWLIDADGIPRRGSSSELRALIDTLAPVARRLDLGEAVGVAADVVRGDGRPGGVVVVTDLQATAVTPATVTVPVVVVAVTEPTVANVGLAALGLGAQPWGLDGARITVAVTGDSALKVPVRVQLGDRPARQALVSAGAPATVALSAARPGWYEVKAELDADELRADDIRLGGVRVAAVAGARWNEAGRFVGAALETLRDNGRVRDGGEVTVGALAPGASVVLPPTEEARVGAVNRALEQRGVPWRFGAMVEQAATTDSGTWLGSHGVARRYRLVPEGSGLVGVLATVGGEPWLVRSGTVVLVGSRLEPEWTDLPYSAAFLPFIDALVNRVARGEVATSEATVGEPTLLPDAVTAVRRAGEEWKVEGGGGFRAPTAGVYWLIAGKDTVGTLGAGADPRESVLAPAPAGSVERLWHARVVSAESPGTAAFALAARADLRGALLWLALVCGLAELILAGRNLQFPG